MEFLDTIAQGLVLWIVGLPLATAVLLVSTTVMLPPSGLPELPESVWRVVGIGTSISVFIGMLFGIGFAFDPEQLGPQFVNSVARSDGFGAHLILGIDGIGFFFMLSTAGLVPLAMLAAVSQVRESVRAWVAVCLTLETCLLGALASMNLLSFLFFWAISLVPILVWLGRWGATGRGRAASRIWTVETMGLAAMLFVAFFLHKTSEAQLGTPTLDVVAAASGISGTLLEVVISRENQRLLFASMVFGLSMRLPLVPLHFWLPGAHASAPLGLSIVLSTGFVQVAAIGLLRFALPLFPNAATELGPLLSLLGIIALGYASLVALVQKELKRLVAYASVGYAGFAVFGISTLNVQGMTGAVLQILSHGFAIAGLFILVGFLSARRGTTEVAAFGGLAKPMPVCAFFFGFMVLSLMGLPLLGGFVGDLFVLLGSLETRRELSLVALVAMVVSASYLLWVQRRLFLGPVNEPANRGLIDLDQLERGLLMALAVPILIIGIHPNPVLRRVEPAVLEILYRMEQRSLPSDVIPLPPQDEGDAPVELVRARDRARRDAKSGGVVR